MSEKDDWEKRFVPELESAFSQLWLMFKIFFLRLAFQDNIFCLFQKFDKFAPLIEIRDLNTEDEIIK